ncbi:MAG: hypothetical protein ACRDP8_16280 [Actinopolymorphaceae bacterium]
MPQLSEWNVEQKTAELPAAAHGWACPYTSPTTPAHYTALPHEGAYWD